MTVQLSHFPAVDYIQTIPESNAALGAEITRLAGHINAATYRFLKLLAVLVARDGWHGEGSIKSPAHWLNYYCGIALGAAREKVRVAQCLESLPLIDEAFKTGALSYSKVRAMTRVATPDNEDYLLYIAQYGTASHMEKLVRKYQYVERINSGDGAASQQDARSVSWYYDEDGMLNLSAKLPAEVGAIVLQAIELAFQAQKREQPEPNLEAIPPKHVSAETFSDEMLPEETYFKETAFGREPKATYEQTRADALGLMAEHLLATLDEDVQGLASGDKYQVMVHVTADSLTGDCHLQDGPFLAPATARRLACDAGLLTVLEDGAGNTLGIGRKSRVVPSSTRRALNLRDPGCRFPGCTESRYVDAHHIQHWCDGGETHLDNLVLLCRYHHRLLHEGGYTLYLADNSQLVFVDPANQRIHAALYPQFATDGMSTENVSAETLFLEAENEQLGLAIDTETALTQWRGESMDYDMAVGALWDLARKLPTGNASP